MLILITMRRMIFYKCYLFSKNTFASDAETYIIFKTINCEWSIHLTLINILHLLFFRDIDGVELLLCCYIYLSRECWCLCCYFLFFSVRIYISPTE